MATIIWNPNGLPLPKYEPLRPFERIYDFGRKNPKLKFPDIDEDIDERNNRWLRDFHLSDACVGF